ncbi:TIGR03619 family F420-dependent LLM class oxidoreductase [Streptomyces phaeolivaceus]|uniref:TIGR03619 family F420-dependent LLM class oxidoreductase n=1 Tax=Streptomyces phaeolivaceus TaxID=2653200 RepID=A0A5P8K7C1_9ACTN|nr:TIGR03619 family F420-dependent LLM class oxidoreductase [Streptomyces phaeolivaceus]QFQ98940.1 TIGR03619 family F420-dependent LLM class oxidoreductase [Streptomyces phaeolivaceus]
MRIGLAVPQYGAFATPEAIVEVARAAEEMGYDSLWAADRILTPREPSDPYPGGDGTMPEQFRTFLDPLTVLTLAGSVTGRVRLGTSTLNALWHPPVLLARTLTSLDVLSRGRLDVGLGLGWLRDEYTAVGVPWEGRGARLEEWLDVAEAVWTRETVRHDGERWTIPASGIQPKPVQSPRPPILFGGFSHGALERIGRRGDGWLSAGLPLPALSAMWGAIRLAADAAGRDSQALRMVVRVNLRLTGEEAPLDLVPHVGTVGQVADYLLSTADAGADEVLVDLQQTTDTTDELLTAAEALLKRLRA